MSVPSVPLPTSLSRPARPRAPRDRRIPWCGPVPFFRFAALRIFSTEAAPWRDSASACFDKRLRPTTARSRPQEARQKVPLSLVKEPFTSCPMKWISVSCRSLVSRAPPRAFDAFTLFYFSFDASNQQIAEHKRTRM